MNRNDARNRSFRVQGLKRRSKPTSFQKCNLVVSPINRAITEKCSENGTLLTFED